MLNIFSSSLKIWYMWREDRNWWSLWRNKYSLILQLVFLCWKPTFRWSLITVFRALNNTLTNEPIAKKVATRIPKIVKLEKVSGIYTNQILSKRITKHEKIIYFTVLVILFPISKYNLTKFNRLPRGNIFCNSTN